MANQRRFSGSVLAHDREALAVTDVQVHAIQRTGTARVHVDEAADPDHCNAPAGR
jgi:hypothetical protein